MSFSISCRRSGFPPRHPTSRRIFKTLGRENLRVKGLNEDGGEWDAWRAFQLSSLVMCIHVPFDMGSIPVVTAAAGMTVDALTYFQLTGIHLMLSCCELYMLHRLLSHFDRRYLLGKRLFHCEISSRSSIEGIVMGMTALGLGVMLSTAMPVVDSGMGMIVLKEGDPLARITEGLDAVAMTPILEETVYRGVLLSCLSMSLTVPWSVFLSASMFAWMHASHDALVVHWVSGVVFGIGYLKAARNLWTPIVAHGLYNTIAVFLLVSQ